MRRTDAGKNGDRRDSLEAAPYRKTGPTRPRELNPRHGGRTRSSLVVCDRGAMLSLAEPIGLLIVRLLTGSGPVLTELSQQRATYAYVFVKIAGVLSVCLLRLSPSCGKRSACNARCEMKSSLRTDLSQHSMFRHPRSAHRLLLDQVGRTRGDGTIGGENTCQSATLSFWRSSRSLSGGS